MNLCRSKTTTLREMCPWLVRGGLLFVTLALAWVALSPMAQAQCPNKCDANANTAFGASALSTNTTGLQNTAVGVDALTNNNADSNTAMGAGALQINTTGSVNTAMGLDALFKNASGFQNAAVGVNSLHDNATGNNNAAEGYQALLHSTGSNNIALGANAGSNLTTGSNNIDIGNVGVAAESAKIRIGTTGTHKATFIAGIFSAPMTGSTVVVNSAGKLGVATSSARFKTAIKPMAQASEAVLALKPVTFRYKNDEEETPQFGLIAEEVAKVNPDLVIRDDEGKAYTVRYEAVNAMLLNEFLKEHRKVEEQQATITRLESKVAEQELAAVQQQKQIEALTLAVQKVSDKLELSEAGRSAVAGK